MAAVAQDQTAAAEKSAMLMSATGGSPAGVGSEYVIEPPSTLTAEDSDDGSEGENDDDVPLDRQASPFFADDIVSLPHVRPSVCSSVCDMTSECWTCTMILSGLADYM